MEHLMAIFKYFDWVAIAMASIATSLALSVLNRTSKGKEIHDGILVLIASFVFTVLLMDFSDFAEHWQSKVFQCLLTIMVSYLFAISKGQQFVDQFLEYAGKYGGKFFQKQEEKLNKPEDPPPSNG